MQSIGERLEEARKRQGISLREAAEATKIRGEFLDAMENDSMDIPLEEVYLRGFLSNYAKFLKINPAKLLTDYDAIQISQGKGGKEMQRDLLGRMELPEKETLTDAPDLNRNKYGKTKSEDADWEPYLKAALFFGGAILVVAIVVLIVKLILPGASPEINPGLRDGGTMAETTQDGYVEEEITLIAQDDVTVTVTQTSDNSPLFSGTLAKGETQTLTKRGPVRIGFTEGDNLLVQKGDQKYKMGKPGVGSSTLD